MLEGFLGVRFVGKLVADSCDRRVALATIASWFERGTWFSDGALLFNATGLCGACYKLAPRLRVVTETLALALGRSSFC